MANAAMFRPYVEQQVAALLKVEKVEKTADGDIPVVRGSNVTLIRVFDAPEGPTVRFFSPFLTGVQASPELFDRLNALNVHTPYVRFLWTNDAIICGMDLLADNLPKEAIAHALTVVLGHAEQAGAALEKDFGGSRMVKHDHAAKPATGNATSGGYL